MSCQSEYNKLSLELKQLKQKQHEEIQMVYAENSSKFKELHAKMNILQNQLKRNHSKKINKFKRELRLG